MTNQNNFHLRGLYAILDTATLPQTDIITAALQAILGGAAILQYRDKSQDIQKRLSDAYALQSLCRQHNIVFIINDDLTLAKECKADGVHLGREDASIEKARLQLGANSIIGLSCYNNFNRAQEAQKKGANYIAFGAFFASPTKPKAARAGIELLQRAKQELAIPVCAIGGITSENGAALINAGADMLAAISAVFNQANIQTAAQQFALLFKS